MSDGKKLRGFAAMSPERRREVASMGGKTSQSNGTAHVFTSEDAQIFGLNGAARRWWHNRAPKTEKSKT